MIDTEDDLFPVAKLRDLSKHIFHGRAWIPGQQADVCLKAVLDKKDDMPEGEACVWHDWFSDHTYEITFAATKAEHVKTMLAAIEAKWPRARLYTATKAGMIDHEDWKTFNNR
jgi:hypothetical protein